MSRDKHCWWFSEDSGRCMNRKNSGSPLASWCCAGKSILRYVQHEKRLIMETGCEIYKGLEAD